MYFEADVTGIDAKLGLSTNDQLVDVVYNALAPDWKIGILT